MASKEGEGAEPLQLKTCVLKVSIHCEGCKKKVRRILQRCEGVGTIEIDSKQNKVTVTGNVEAKTLIRKLLKSGKHAVLWPAEKKTKTLNPDPNSNNSEKEKNKGKEQNASNPSEHPNLNSASSEKEKNKGKELNASKPNELNVLKQPEKSSETATKSEIKSETDMKSTDTVPKEEAPAKMETVTAKKTTEPIETDTKSDTKTSENSGKEASKSDTKPENSNKAASKSENDTKSADTVDESADRGSKQDKKEAEDEHSDMNSIRHQVYHEPIPSVYPQPVYVAGYNVVHPTSSYSYYAPAPAMSQGYIYSDHPPLVSQGYNYMDNPPLENYPNYVHGNYYGSMGYEASSSSSRGYDYFNDEDPNSCSVM